MKFSIGICWKLSKWMCLHISFEGMLLMMLQPSFPWWRVGLLMCYYHRCSVFIWFWHLVTCIKCYWSQYYSSEEGNNITWLHAISWAIYIFFGKWNLFLNLFSRERSMHMWLAQIIMLLPLILVSLLQFLFFFSSLVVFAVCIFVIVVCS